MMSASPTDRVAQPNTIEFELKNVSPYIYSPDSASAATGWDIGTKVRIKLVSGANTRYWMFRISDITVMPGVKAERRVKVVANDYMEELNRRKITGLTVQLNKRADELFTTLIAQMPIAPTATSYGTGLYVHPYAFAEETDEATMCMTIAQKIAQSGMCYVYVDGDATGGETLVLEVPEERYRATSSATFSNDMIAMQPRRSRQDIFNSAKTTITPVSVALTATTVGETDDEIALEPGESSEVKIRYVDAGTSKRVTAVNPISPVAGTDYDSWDKTNGAGNNMNASLTLTGTDNGNSMTIALTNGHATKKIYIPSIVVRGQLATGYNKQDVKDSDATSITAYGETELSFNMPYASHVEVAKTVAAEMIRRYKDPHTQITSLKFNANRSSTFMGYALTLGIGDKVTITETVTALSSSTYYINGMEYELLSGSGSYTLNVTLYLERDFAAGNTYFVVGTSALGGAHILMPL